MRRHPPRHRGRQEGSGDASEVLFGVNPVREALRAKPAALETLLVVPGARAVEPLVAEARAHGLAVQLVDRGTLDRLTGRGHHQGVAVRARPFAYLPFAELLAAQSPLLVAVDGVSDPQNLGSIVRSAEVLGAGGLVLPRDRAAPVTAAVARASAGATSHLPISQVVNLTRALLDAKEHGYWIIGLDAGGRAGFEDLPALDRALLVIGSEGRGGRRLVLETCDFVVRIPVRGRVASLNAAIAGAIALHALAGVVGQGANR
jgi:23S rRNA (guanosine2251-2'-O)-methyltransferase